MPATPTRQSLSPSLDFGRQSASREREPAQEALLRWLASSSTYPGGPAVTVQETHASRVFVAGERAYKVKKPVALGFLDYSTLDRRRAACHEEVHVNRRLAPDIYLGVRAIVRTRSGFLLAPEHTDCAVEYVVEMRAFRDQDTLAGLIAAGALSPKHVEAVARRLAAFHRTAIVVASGGPGRVLATWRKNVDELDDAAAAAGRQWRIDVPRAFGESFVRAHADEHEQRRHDGFVRDGHGDLRCEHVLIHEGVRIVDRIEFDPLLRRTDVAADLAFLTMDLEALGQEPAAHALVRAYRDAGGNPGTPALRSFYAAHCALVRAKVALIAAAAGDDDQRSGRLEHANALWALAERLCWRARRPLAIVICGPAASGKSVLGGGVARWGGGESAFPSASTTSLLSPPPPPRSGMQVASSDVLRKRLAGLPPEQRALPEHYSEQFTRATYELLGEEAVRHLQHEQSVIVDATFHTRADRNRFRRAVDSASTNRLFVRCAVPLEVAADRAAIRLQDTVRVSDATPEIVAQQFRTFEPLDELSQRDVLCLNTERSLESQVAEVALALDGRGQSTGARSAPAADAGPIGRA
jgi:uncharacterized protein